MMNWLDDTLYDCGHHPVFVFDMDDTLCEPGKEVLPNMVQNLRTLKRQTFCKTFISTASSLDTVTARAAGLLVGKEPLVDGIVTGLCSSFAAVHPDQLGPNKIQVLGTAEPLAFTLEDIQLMNQLVADSPFPHKTGKHLLFHTNDSYASFSILGKEHSQEAREAYIEYDYETDERVKVIEKLKESFDGRYEVFSGGRTGIDIVHWNNAKDSINRIIDWHVDKAFFIGDGFETHGNDVPMENVFNRRNIFRVNDFEEASRFIYDLCNYSSVQVDLCL